MNARPAVLVAAAVGVALAAEPGSVGSPVWSRLMGMSRAERLNSRVRIPFDQPLARRFESLWNRGRFGEALELCRRLGSIELGLGWREPMPAPEVDWGEDAPVSGRDSVLQVRLDWHRPTGHLFSIIRYAGDGLNTSWSCNFSTDGGRTWSETYNWWAAYRVGDVAAACQGEYCYVGFPRGAGQDQAFLYRFRVSDGQQESFPGGQDYLVLDSLGGEPIADVAVRSNADAEQDNRLYYGLVAGSGRLKLWLIDPGSNFDTVECRGLPADAGTGLDLAWNQQGAGYYLLVSYVDTTGWVQVYGVRAPADTLELLHGGEYNSAGDYTSLAAWRDTFLVCFEVQSSNRQCGGLASTDNGVTWEWEAFGDTTEWTGSCAATARCGYGQAAFFWQSPEEPDGGLSFVWRPYDGEWSLPLPVWDCPADSTRCCAVEPVDSAVHGVVYVAGQDGGQAYFDRSDWVGIREQPAAEPAHGLALSTTATEMGLRVSFRLRKPGPVRLCCYDATGRRLCSRASVFGTGTHSVQLAVRSVGVCFVQIAFRDGVTSAKGLRYR